MADEKLDLILDELKSINPRLEMLELKHDFTHKKLDNMTLDIKVSERSIKKDIKLLQDAQDTLVEVLEQNGILPKIK
ncbi:hypothetical protein [Murimonas intestini]|uniref:Uncharacterized protein n=1 Tax=Murimonas intestini TaxID=1337051 RepID=A0AB73T7E3_9FIRM|nr:hypothetical protein [Murimonas intestini]MCR1839638.1 hypothetical protein [Murimonas intestini]MCR1866481.1 hypothetical protein [Murimonas intestini]MCR1884895.1 hypothetical protein [Murimonas intestini]